MSWLYGGQITYSLQFFLMRLPPTLPGASIAAAGRGER
jgi:hypothetical protein